MNNYRATYKYLNNFKIENSPPDLNEKWFNQFKVYLGQKGEPRAANQCITKTKVVLRIACKKGLITKSVFEKIDRVGKFKINAPVKSQ